jgi:hypothetical protein
MMYMCLEIEFDLEGQDMWDACSFYNRVINSVADDITGLNYYK